MPDIVIRWSFLWVVCVTYGLVTVDSETAVSISVEKFTAVPLKCSVEHDNIKIVSVNWIRELKDGTKEQISSGKKTFPLYDDKAEINKPRANDWDLKLLNVTKDMEGTYVCKMFENGDEVNEVTRYDLSVIHPNKGPVTDKPATIEMNKSTGDKVAMTCSTQQPETVVSWYRQEDIRDEELDEAYRREVLISEGLTTYKDSVNITNDQQLWTLTITRVNTMFVGTYVCKVGDIELALYQIVVDGIRHILWEIATHHETKTLPCVSQDITTERLNHVLWKHNSKVLHRFKPETRPGSSTLKLTRITPNDFDGIYECTISNKPICIFGLEIHRKPFIDGPNEKEEKTFTENDMANLTCRILGRPEPTITWYREQKVEGAIMERIGVVGKTLLIPNIPRYAADKYTCEGNNSRGDKRYVIDVKVSFEPEVEAMNAEVTICRYTDVTLTCFVQSSIENLKTSIQWSKNGNTIQKNYKYQPGGHYLEGYPVYVATLKLLITNQNKELDFSGTYNCGVLGENRQILASSVIIVKDLKHNTEKQGDVEIGPYC